MNTKRSLIVICAALAAAIATSGAASARECKSETVTAEGAVASLRDLGAYPSSLFAWRNAVKEKFGAEWNSWRYAKDGKIDCKEITSGAQKGWICKRAAIPCQDTLSSVVEKVEEKVEQVAQKKTCKDEPLSAFGTKAKTEEKAIEESKWGWRIDAKKKYGADWAKWDNSSNSDHDCRKVGDSYQCIAVAIACKPN